MGYGAVDRQTWNDERFRSWARDVQRVWLYLLTCPHGNRLGCFVLDPLYVASDAQISRERALECLEYLDDEERIVWDEGNRVVCILRHLHPDYNPLANQNVVKAAVKDLKELPNSPRAIGALFWAVEKWGRSHYTKLVQALENRMPNGSETVRQTASEGYPEFTRVTPDPDPDPEQDPDPEGQDMGDGDEAPPPESELPEWVDGPPSDWPSPSRLPKGESGDLVYPVEFEEVWADRVPRDGKNPKKRGYRQYRKSRRGGMSREQADLALDYRRREAERKGDVGERQVEQFATFFGQDDLWRDYLRSPDPADVHEMSQADRRLAKRRAELEAEDLEQVPI